MRRDYLKPTATVVACDADILADADKLDDAELKVKLEQFGYSFDKRFQTKKTYIHRKVAGNEVLISIGENIANFNGYIELNASAAFLWDQMKEPCTLCELEKALEESFGLPYAQAVEDVLDFLNELQEHEMIEVK